MFLLEALVLAALLFHVSKAVHHMLLHILNQHICILDSAVDACFTHPDLTIIVFGFSGRLPSSGAVISFNCALIIT